MLILLGYNTINGTETSKNFKYEIKFSFDSNFRFNFWKYEKKLVVSKSRSDSDKLFCKDSGNSFVCEIELVESFIKEQKRISNQG